MIPLFSPLRQNEPLLADMEKRLSQILRSGEYILGRDVAELEEGLARQTGYRHAVGCASGTDAIVLGLKALQLPEGAEVITPAFSFVASASSVVWAGLTPRFCDVDPDTYNVSVETVSRAITSRTRAVVAVDLFGRQAPIRELRELCDRKGLFLLEDGAQSIGVAPAGAHVYTTSFYPTKNVGAVGDAGAVMTDDEEVARRVRELTRHGGLTRDRYLQVGTTSRIDTLQAAVLNVKLPRVEEWRRRRREVAAEYSRRFAEPARSGRLRLPQSTEQHVWALYTVRISEKRDAVAEALRAKGVGCAIYYPRTIPSQPALERFGDGAFPTSERLCAEVLSLPFFPELTDGEIECVADSLCECLSTSM